MRSPDPEFACPLCLTKEKAVAVATADLPDGECRLQDIPDGARTCVRELRGCSHLRSRLYSLGLLPGTEITVCGHGDSGCRIQVRDSCVVLDCESANSILCDAAGGVTDGADASPAHRSLAHRCLTRKGLFGHHGFHGPFGHRGQRGGEGGNHD